MRNHLGGSSDTRVPCSFLPFLWTADQLLFHLHPGENNQHRKTILHPGLRARRLSVCPYRLFFLLLPRSGRAAVHTVCPLGRSASGPKTSCAQINCPDLAVPSPSDSDPDVSRQRKKKKKGQISIFPSSDYL